MMSSRSTTISRAVTRAVAAASAALAMLIGMTAATPARAQQAGWAIVDGTASPLDGAFIADIVADRFGGVWVGAGDSILHYNNRSEHDVIEYLPRNLGWSPTRLALDGDEDLYVGAGPVLFHRHGRLVPVDTLPSPVTALQVDAQGEVWIGTENSGLFCGVGTERRSIWNQRPAVRPVSRDAMDYGASVFDIDADTSGSMWISTSVGLVQYDGSAFMVYDSTNSAIRASLIYGTVIDRNGVIWISGMPPANFTTFDHGVWRHFDHVAAELERGTPGTPSYWGYALALSPSGGIVLGSQLNGWLARYDWGQWRGLATPMVDSTHSGISKIAFDRNGTMWVGTFGRGLLRYDGLVPRECGTQTQNEMQEGPGRWRDTLHPGRRPH